jgi:DNA-binding LytR/AlgR family response regulator
MKLKCVIADDEPMARRLLQEYIEDIDFLELRGSVENALKAGNLLNTGPVDLLFLDINMPKLSGIGFLRTAGILPMVIMTTAHADYAAEAFELDVLDYLVKPFSFERCLKACNRAREMRDLKVAANAAAAPGDIKPDDNYFFVKCDGRIEKVLYDDLVYIEAQLNYVTLHSTHGRLMVYHTIKGILEQLPSERFFKVHKSIIVNLSKIKGIEGNEIDLGTARVTISQHSYADAMKAILRDRMIKR